MRRRRISSAVTQAVSKWSSRRARSGHDVHLPPRQALRAALGRARRRKPARGRSLGRTVLRNLRGGGLCRVASPRQSRNTARSTAAPASPGFDDLPTLRISSWSRRRRRPFPAIVASAGRKGVARRLIVITAGLGHGAGSLAEEARLAARRHGLRLVGPNCLGVHGARGEAQRELRGPERARRRSRAGLAIGRRRGRAARVGGAAPASASRASCRSATRSTSISAIASTISRADRATRAILLYIEAIDDAAQVHVGGARRRAHEAGRRRSSRGRHAQGAQGGRDPHRRARRLGRGLRGGISPRRASARARPRRALRRRRDARAAEAVSGQAARHPDERRRRRRARGRPPDRSRRHACRHCRRTRWRPSTRRCRRPGRAAIRSTSSATRTRRATRAPSSASWPIARTTPCWSERPDRAGLAHRNRAGGRRRGQARPRRAFGRKPVFAVWLGEDEVGRALRGGRHSHYATEADAVRGFMHLVRYREAQKAADGDAAEPAAGFRARYAAARRQSSRSACGEGRHLARSARGQRAAGGLRHPGRARDARRDRRGGGGGRARRSSPRAARSRSKILSPDIVHKSDIGGVQLDLTSENAVHDAARRHPRAGRAAASPTRKSPASPCSR